MPVILAVSALLLLALLVLRLRQRAIPAAPSADLSVYRDLRTQLFATDPSAVGIPDPVPGTRNGVFGIAMEIGFPNGTATVAGLGDGTASLYLETGGGVIGTGRHERVHLTAVAFVEAADGIVEQGDLTVEPPLPASLQVCFHWLSRDGLLTKAAPEEELKSGAHPLAPLYTAGHALLTEMRLVSEFAGRR